MNFVKSLSRYIETPWLLVAVAALGYMVWTGSGHLVELLVWQLGVIAVALPFASGVYRWLFPGEWPADVAHSHGPWSRPALAAKAILTVIVCTVILALAFGF